MTNTHPQKSSPKGDPSAVEHLPLEIVLVPLGIRPKTQDHRPPAAIEDLSDKPELTAAATIVASALAIPLSHARRITDLACDPRFLAMEDALRAVFEPLEGSIDRYPAALAALRNAIKLRKEWLAEALRDPIDAKVLDAGADFTRLERPEAPQPHNRLLGKIAAALRILQRPKEAHLKPFFTLLAHLQELHRSAPLNAPLIRPYAEEFMKALPPLLPAFLPPPGEPADTQPAGRLDPADAAWCADINRAVAAAGRHLPHLKETGHWRAAGIFGAIGEGFRDISPLAVYIVDRLSASELKPRHYTLVQHLLEAAPPKDRNWLFDVMADAPQIVELFNKIRSAGVSAATFVDFFLSDAFQPIKIPGMDPDSICMAALIDLAQHRKEAAAVFISEGRELLHQPELPQLWEIGRAWHSGFLVLLDYSEACALGEKNRKTLLLKLGEFRPDDKTLSDLRRGLRRIPDEDLSPVSRASSLVEMTRELRRLERPYGESPELTLPRTAPRQRSWIEALKAGLSRLEGPAVSEKLVDQALAELPPESRTCLRELRCSVPRALHAFCLQAVKFGRSEAFRVLINDPVLFRGYQELLVRDPCRASGEFEELLGAEPSNPYKALREWLARNGFISGPAADTRPDAGANTDSEQQRTTAGRDFKRVIVFGNFKDEARKAAVRGRLPGIEIEFFRPEEDKPFSRQLGPNDLVMFMSSAASHADYCRVKALSKKAGASFYHISEKGVDPLIHQIAALKA